MSSFDRAQSQWEASWVNGPADDPLDTYYERIEAMELDELREELRTLKAIVGDPDFDQTATFEMIHAVTAEIAER